MSTDEIARVTLATYDSVVKNVVRHIVLTFEPNVDRDDATQEARLLLMSYAGILPGRHNGVLTSIEQAAHPRALLATQLRLDLYDVIGKRLSRIPPTYSLNEVIEKEADPLDEYLEDRIIERVDAERDIYSRYPYLTMVILDGMTHLEDANHAGVSERTVLNRLAEEKARFIADHPNAREMTNAA